MAKDTSSGFPDPEQFGVAPASLPTGWTSMTPLVPASVDAPPQPFVLPPYIAAQQTSLVAQAQRALALDISGTHSATFASRPITRVVASAAATPAEKAGADRVCDGFADQTEINEELLIGDVILTGPSFATTSPILMLDGRTLSGLGVETVITRAAGASVIESDSSASEDIRIANLTVSANGTTQAMLFTDCVRVVIEGCTLIDGDVGVVFAGTTMDSVVFDSYLSMSTYGVDFQSSTARCHAVGNRFTGTIRVAGTDCLLNSNTIDDSSGDGVLIFAALATTLSGNTVRNNAGSGVSMQSGAQQCVLSGNTISGNAGDGISFASGSGAHNNIITGNIIRNNDGNGILVSDADFCLIESNHIRNNSQGTDDTSDGIFLQTADRNLIQGNLIHRGTGANQQRYGIRIDTNTCDNNWVTNNDVRLGGKTAGLSDAGTGTLFGPGNDGVHTHASAATGGVLTAPTGMVTLTPSDFRAVEGSPALTNYLTSAGTTQGIGGWALDGAADESVQASVRLPSHWLSGDITAKTRWFLAVAAGAGEDVRVGVGLNQVTVGDTIAGTGNNFQEALATISVASGAQYMTYSATWAFTVTNPLTADDTLFFTFLRRGGAAADDYNSDIVLFDVTLEFTAKVV